MPVKRNIDSNCTNATCSSIILDIEGTTTSINFVKDGLFPYVRKHIEQYVIKKWSDKELQEDLALLIDQSKEDTSNNLEGAVIIPEGNHDDTKKSMIKSVLWLMDNDRKVRALKQLQGHIWQEGYNAGELRGHVYDDVAENLKKWTEDGKKVYIYSSGSVQAQKLLFGHSEKGNLLPFISGHFDTEIGAKGDASSYSKILEELKCEPNDVLFLTDVPKEASAANEAGIKSLIVVRDGNTPLSEEDKAKYSAIKSFHEVHFCNPIKKQKMSLAVLDIVQTRNNLNEEITDHNEFEEVAITPKNDNAEPIQNMTVRSVEKEVKGNTFEAVSDSSLNGSDKLTETSALKSEVKKQSKSDDARVEVIQTVDTLKNKNSEYIEYNEVSIRSKQKSLKGNAEEAAKEISSTEFSALQYDHEIDTFKNEARERIEDVEMAGRSDKKDKSGQVKEDKVKAVSVIENVFKCMKHVTESDVLLSEPNEDTPELELLAEPIEDVEMAVINDEKTEKRDRVKLVKDVDDILKSIGNNVEISALQQSEVLEKDTSKQGVAERIDVIEMTVTSDEIEVGVEDVKGNENSSNSKRDVKETDALQCAAQEEKITEVPPIEEVQNETAAGLVDGPSKEVLKELPCTTTDSERGEIDRPGGKKEDKEMPPTMTNNEHGRIDRADGNKEVKEMPPTTTVTDRSVGKKEIKGMLPTTTDNENDEIHRSDGNKEIKEIAPNTIVKMATGASEHTIDKEELMESRSKKQEAECSVFANGEKDKNGLNVEEPSDKQCNEGGDGDRAALNGVNVQLVETKKKIIGSTGDVLNDEEITEV